MPGSLSIKMGKVCIKPGKVFLKLIKVLPKARNHFPIVGVMSPRA
jgi:hypothetical protein